MTSKNRSSRTEKEKADVAETTKERKGHGSHGEKRVRRDDLIDQGPLAYDKADFKARGMRPYWVNDRPMRLEQFSRLGYTHVLDDKGEPIKRPVREGAGYIDAYLMETTEELYQQGIVHKRNKNKQTVSSLTPDPAKGQYGEGLEVLNK